MQLKNIYNTLLDLIYPPSLYCISCGKIIDDTRIYRLCNECFDDVKWATDRTCNICGKPLSHNNVYDTCFSCREHIHGFDRGYTCCEYGQIARSVAFGLKYNDRTDIAKTMAEMIHDKLELVREVDDAFGYDCIVAVPIHENKLATRGYNQAGLIAEELSRLEGKPYLERVLVRVSETSAMKALTPAERRVNIYGAFDVDRSRRSRSGEVAGKTVLVVDDIYTTGATADEMARLLRELGAARVVMMTFAAGADVIKVD